MQQNSCSKNLNNMADGL